MELHCIYNLCGIISRLAVCLSVAMEAFITVLTELPS